jgi:hypothetical protein
MSGTDCLCRQSREHFFWGFPRTLKVDSIWADVDRIRPGDLTDKADIGFFKCLTVVPESKRPLSAKMAEVDLSFCFIGVSDPSLSLARASTGTGLNIKHHSSAMS